MAAAKLNRNDAITNFIILECLAVLGFGLGGVNIIFYALAVLVSLFAIFVAWNSFDKQEGKTLAIYGGVVLVFSALYSFGKLYQSSSKVLENILVMLAFNGALFLGVASRKIKSIKPELILAVLGVSVALLISISTIATWSQYGLFYRQIYANHPLYYYDGVRYNLLDETIFLNGFKFSEALPNYYCLFGLICFCFLPGCLFINPKEKPTYFWIYFGVGIIGFLSITTLLSVRGLVFLIPIILIAFLYKYLRKNAIFAKILKISLITIAAIFGVFFVLVVINAAGNNAFSNLCASNALLNKIFNNNGIVSGVNKVINYLIVNGDFFGINLAGKNAYQIDETLKVVYTNTGMFEIEVLKEAGVLAFALLLTFIVLEVIMLGKYVKKSEDSDSSKVIFISLLVGVFLFCSFGSTINPFVRINDYMGILRGPIPLIMLFIVGYTLITSDKKTEKVVELVQQPKEQMEEIIL